MNSLNSLEMEITLKNEENKNLIQNREESQNNILQKDRKNEDFFYFQNKKEKNKSFFLFHFFIISLLFVFILTIIYIIYYNTREPNFKILQYDWDNSYLNNRKYENYIFDNGLEIMIIQDESFDRDGGAIVIEGGYMDNPYDEGIISLATLLLNKIAFHEGDNIRFNDYYGQYTFGTEEYYTNFRFDILNNGFKNYLYNFSLILNPKNIDYYYNNFIYEIIYDLYYNYYIKMNNINYKQKHLIEYLVYGLSDINNQDILPEGNVVSFLDNIENDLRRNITEYIKMLLNPSKIKIVFFSKYKILLTAKYVKKYFHYLTTMEKPKDNKIDKYKFEIK